MPAEEFGSMLLSTVAQHAVILLGKRHNGRYTDLRGMSAVR